MIFFIIFGSWLLKELCSNWSKKLLCKSRGAAAHWLVHLRLGLPLTSSFLPEYSSEYLNEYSSTRYYRKYFNTSCRWRI